MILAAVHLLDRQPQPTLEQIKEGLSGNLCRCTGYMQIFEAIQKVARGNLRDEADPREYELVAPDSLGAVAALLANEPGQWTPIAGGTDVMVLYAAGKLTARKLVSVGNLAELRRIEVIPDEVQIGASCTYSDLQKHETILREFPMLASAASWTGGVANQNRGTWEGILRTPRRRRILCPRCWLMKRNLISFR